MNGRSLLPLALLTVLPIALLATVVFGGRTYVPYDIATAPPAAWQYDPAEVDRARDGANQDVTEIPAWFAPELRAARNQLSEGRWPGWQPWSHGGTVLQPHGLDGMLYPPVWLAIAADDPLDVLHWIAWLHFAVAGLLTFGMLRAFGLGSWGATFGGVVFACSATVCANAPFYMRTGSLVWLPGMLWACLAIRDAAPHRRLRPMLGLTVTMALTWLAGFPPYSAACTLLTAAFCACLIVQRGMNAERDRVRSAAPLAGWLLAGAVFGLGLAAIHLLPVLAFFPESARSVAPEFSQLSHNVFPSGALLGYLMPEVFGHMTEHELLPYARSPLAWLYCGRTEWETGRVLPPAFNATEYAVFVGTLPLLFAPFAFAPGRRPWFAGGAFLVLFLLATGAPLFRLAFHLPGVATIPPMRFMGPATLCLAWVAATGFDRALQCRSVATWSFVGGIPICIFAFVGLTDGSYLLNDGEYLIREARWVERIADQYRDLLPQGATEADVRAHFRAGDKDFLTEGANRFRMDEIRLLVRLLTAGVLLALAGGLLRNARGRVVFCVLVFGATGFELIEHGRRANLGVHALPSAQTPVHEFLAQQRSTLTEQGGFAVARATQRAEPTSPTFVPPSTLLDARVRDWQIYTFVDRLSNEPFIELWARTLIRAAGGRWDRVSAEQQAEARRKASTYILAGTVPAAFPDDPGFLRSPYLDLIGIRWLLTPTPLSLGPPTRSIAVGPRRAHLYERPGALPRAFTVAGLTPLPTERAAAERLAAPDLDLRRAITVGPTEADAASREGPTSAPRREVRFTTDEPDQVVVEVGPGSDPWLVVADTALSGWTATIDGEPVAIETANLWMRRLPIPATSCTVAFHYSPAGLRPGLIVTALTAVGLLVLWGSVRRRRRRSSRTETPVENPV